MAAVVSSLMSESQDPQRASWDADVKNQRYSQVQQLTSAILTA
jgi:hypothetical protein